MLLRSLPDDVVLSRTLDIRKNERRMTVALLEYLNEIERRKLHLRRGHSSMFDYCTSALGYSEGSAVRRIRSARCVARFPVVRSLLESGDVTLCTLSKVARHLTPANHAALLERIRGASQRVTDAIVAELEPRSKPVEMMRPVAVKAQPEPDRATLSLLATNQMNVASGARNPAQGAPGALAACENTAYRHSGGKSGAKAPLDSRPVESPTETRTLIRFSADEDFMTSYRKVQSLAWHRLPAGASIEDTPKLALDAFIEANDPAKRQARREAHVRKHEKKAQVAARNPRHVPAAVRDHVNVRDERRCTYVSPAGRRCAATTGLQVDHVVPVALGGAGTSDNLRLLCAAHNRIEAERVLGLPCPPLELRRESRV